MAQDDCLREQLPVVVAERHIRVVGRRPNRRGGDGWLYQKCPFVAYERKNDFVILLKKDLRSWIEASNLPRWDLPFVDSSWKAACRLFSRPNTKEAIFHLKLSDAIKNCKHQIWPKDEGSS